MSALFRLLFSVSLLGILATCAKKETLAPTPAPVAKHEHHAPHGGTPVVLGDEAYHLELVRNDAAGKLTAYILDGELEDFVRVKAASFEIDATLGGAKQPLIFRAVANPATGETVSDTSQFETQADWLKTTAAFDATLITLEIRGTAFTAVAFNFPKGNDKD
jgi:hypothetical protein